LPGDPEVDHAGTVRAEQDVGGLEIPMDHARPVDRDQGGDGGDRQPVQGGTGQRLPADAAPLGMQQLDGYEATVT
jgi:hypothetical protein